MILDPWSRHVDLRQAHLAKLRPTWSSPIAKAGETGTADYQWLHDIADAAAPAVRRAFLDAIAKVRGTVKETQLAAALETRDVAQVLRVLDIDQSVAAALSGPLQTRLEDEFIEAGREAIGQSLPKAIQASIRFDMTNPEALSFLRSYDFGLIRQVTQETKNAVRRVVLDAFEHGGNPKVQARTIRDFIGLTDRQAQAVINYRDALIEENRPADQLERMVERYRQRMLRLRAENIARTETIRAANAGQNTLWQQAADKGLLDRTKVRRKWIVSLDDRLCAYCAAVPLLNSEGVFLDGMFLSTLGPASYPPLHPQCRCAVALSGL